MQKKSGPARVHGFGDSLIDNGRAKVITTEIVNSPNPPEGAYIKAPDYWCWGGRYSNGPTFAELIAADLGAAYTGYAVGGAKSGPDPQGNTNWSPWMHNTGGIEQTLDCIADNGGSLSGEDIFLIYIGFNDADNIDLGEYEGIEQVARESAGNIGQMVGNLAGAGGRRFIVVQQSYDPKASGLSEYAVYHRAAVKETVDALIPQYKAKVLYADLVPFVDNVRLNPAKYGYKTLSFYLHADWAPHFGFHHFDNTATLGQFGYTYDGFTGGDENGFWEVDQYYVYDETHYSRSTHRHIADYLEPHINHWLSGEGSLQMDAWQK